MNSAVFFSFHTLQQIAASAACAAVSGVLYAMWRKLGDSRRLRIWSYYGRLCALTCTGSCALAVASLAWLYFLKNFYSADSTPNTAAGHKIQNMYNAQAYLWLAAYAFGLPVSFGCLVIAKLLVVQRLAALNDVDMNSASPLVTRVGRLLVALVVFGSFIGVCCAVAAAVFFTQASDNFIAAAAVAVDMTNGTSLLYNTTVLNAHRLVSTGAQISSVFFGFEVITLLVIVVSLFVAGVYGARRIHVALLKARLAQRRLNITQLPILSATHNNNAIAVKFEHAVGHGRRLRCRILTTVICVFVSFLLRAGYSIMFAVANTLSNSSISCDNFIGRCSPCYNDFTHMQIWMVNTPSFYFSIVLISQPLALLVSLWGMTSGHFFTV